MSDLEKFLQQAAERLAQKLNEGQNRGPAQSSGGQRQPPRSVRSAERQSPRRDAEIIDAEIMEPVQDHLRRGLGRDPFTNIDTRPELAQHISQADERMEGHLHEVFDQQIPHLRQSSPPLIPAAPSGETNKSIDLQRRQMDVSPLVKMLRQPETLRAAFLASEIFKRKF